MSNNLKRKDYISWDEYFIGIVKLSSMRSKDPNTQVGACLVSSDNRILSVGYNGAPNGFNDDKFPWGRVGDRLNTKYMYVCHGELNAILNYKGSNRDLENGKIYVDFFPCNECAKAIIQAGIKEVIYSHNYDHDDHGPEMQAAMKMFDECGVKYRKFQADKIKKITLELDN